MLGATFLNLPHGDPPISVLLLQVCRGRQARLAVTHTEHVPQGAGAHWGLARARFLAMGSPNGSSWAPGLKSASDTCLRGVSWKTNIQSALVG